MKISAILFLLVLFPFSLLAQQQDDKAVPYGWAFGLQTGPYLPNQIPNVTEIQPTSIMRFSFPTGPQTATEYMISASNAEGVNLYNFSISGKSEMEMDGLKPQVYIGLDATGYKTSSDSDFTTKGGVHFGIGVVSHLGGKVNFRMDMKFNFSNPGTALQLGFGLEMRYPPSEDNENEEGN